jgi:acarbose 7IV-phosphotransferase
MIYKEEKKVAKILVSGLINIETTLKVNSFPIEYTPVNYPFFGIESTISGVGYNVAKALKVLGNEVEFVSIVGKDMNGRSSVETIEELGISTEFIERTINETAQSVILYDINGVRQINVDLKDLQETEYSDEKFAKASENGDISILCNINFSRKFLKSEKEKGKLIATDVHVLADINDSYNRDFLQYSDILFLSNEHIMGREEQFVSEIYAKYQNKIIVCGLGKNGALIHTAGEGFRRFGAVDTRKIVNTIGAGDALFSAFIHFYIKNREPYEALKKAIVFASWKIGEKGAADGFLSESEVEKKSAEIYG